MRQIQLKIAFIVSIILLQFTMVTTASADIETGLLNSSSKPKNIVIMVGDGMGPAYTTAYRYYQDNPQTEEVEQTVFDRLLVGTSSTYPASVSGYVTDSAASATALATGVKSYNGAISVDLQHQPIPTILSIAKTRNLQTGVVVTSQINHATPAAFLTHNESRRNYDEIAQSLLTTDADIFLGGGQKYFPPKLLKQFTAKGYQHIDQFEQLDTLTTTKVIGLFAEVQLPWVIDEPEQSKLSKMTQKALDLLSQNEQGFVLLVEGSLIDWAGHSNDIATAMAEMDEFAKTVEIVEQFARQQQDTLVVITADHNTGGLSIGANGEYIWSPEVLKKIKGSPEQLAIKALANEQWQQELSDNLSMELTETEQLQLSQARMQGEKRLTKAIRALIDQRSNTGWTTSGHTAMDVQVFATGPAANLFHGQQDNIDIGQKLISLLPTESNE